AGGCRHGQPLVAAGVLALMGYPLHTVLTVPLSLAQIGEFSFILAALARDLHVIPDTALNVVVAVSIVSIFINPVASKAIPPIERWLMRTRSAGNEARGEPAERGT